ncbi:unnamed protein product [Prorocentrum cordatum]|uniref:Uncharacterized protein n=1 Tax=Prorocentrum cordatum TaxID=2364126 RepID=A0ABN9Q6N3_9DINO|nr:unnamed protein product [Polarella glacialis]
MQMVSSKLVEMLLTLFFLSDTFLKWSIELPETRIGPPDQLATLVSGCYLCVVELLLAVLGLRAFDVSEQVYPTPDLTAGYPLDMVAQLQLCGVRQGAYALLSRLEAQAQAPLPPLRESSGEDSDDATGGARVPARPRASAGGSCCRRPRAAAAGVRAKGSSGNEQRLLVPVPDGRVPRVGAWPAARRWRPRCRRPRQNN